MPAVTVYYVVSNFLVSQCSWVIVGTFIFMIHYLIFSGSSFCDLGSLFRHFVHPVQFSIRALASNTVTIPFTVVLFRERSQM